MDNILLTPKESSSLENDSGLAALSYYFGEVLQVAMREELNHVVALEGIPMPGRASTYMNARLHVKHRYSPNVNPRRASTSDEYRHFLMSTLDLSDVWDRVSSTLPPELRVDALDYKASTLIYDSLLSGMLEYLRLSPTMARPVKQQVWNPPSPLGTSYKVLTQYPISSWGSVIEEVHNANQLKLEIPWGNTVGKDLLAVQRYLRIAMNNAWSHRLPVELVQVSLADSVLKVIIRLGSTGFVKSGTAVQRVMAKETSSENSEYALRPVGLTADGSEVEIHWMHQVLQSELNEVKEYSAVTLPPTSLLLKARHFTNLVNVISSRRKFYVRKDTFNQTLPVIG